MRTDTDTIIKTEQSEVNLRVQLFCVFSRAETPQLD